jgi:hypothetical protein
LNLTDNDGWVIIRLLERPDNPYAIWKGAECSHQAIIDSCEKLERLRIIHSSGTKSSHRGKGRGRKYQLEPYVRELLRDPVNFETGIRVLSRALALADTRADNLRPAIFLSLAQEILNGGHFRLTYGSLLEAEMAFFGQLLSGSGFGLQRPKTGTRTSFILKPPTLEQRKAALEHIVGEGPWEIEYEPNKTRPASREEVMAWIAGRAGPRPCKLSGS